MRHSFLPEIGEPVALSRLIAERDPARWLVSATTAEVANPAAALAPSRRARRRV